VHLAVVVLISFWQVILLPCFIVASREGGSSNTTKYYLFTIDHLLQSTHLSKPSLGNYTSFVAGQEYPKSLGQYNSKELAFPFN